MKILLVVLALVAVSLSVDPPVYNYSYHIAFDQAYVVNTTVYRVNGQKYYDPINKRERIDRANGRYNAFCGTVLPNVTTSCQLYTSNDKRWIVFPQKTQCCFCCDSDHGCGILKPDWLDGAEYRGTEKIVDTDYDKWSKDGEVGFNYFWATTDANQIPRRLNENGAHITDYNVHSFHNQTVPFADSIFALPAYCNVTNPNNCPLDSICGKFRLGASTK